MSDFLKELAPAVLAGMVGGLGAFTAVKVDVAVLKQNQVVLEQNQMEVKRDLTVVRALSEGLVKREEADKFLQYQVDMLREDFEKGKFASK